MIRRKRLNQEIFKNESPPKLYHTPSSPHPSHTPLHFPPIPSHTPLHTTIPRTSPQPLKPRRHKPRINRQQTPRLRNRRARNTTPGIAIRILIRRQHGRILLPHENHTLTRIIRTTIRKTPLQRPRLRRVKIVAADIEPASNTIRLAEDVGEGPATGTGAEHARADGARRGSRGRYAGEDAFAAGREARDFGVGVAVRVDCWRGRVQVCDAAAAPEDVAELEAFLERVGVHGLAVAAHELEAAVHVVLGAQGVAVAGVVVAGAAGDGGDCGCWSRALVRDWGAGWCLRCRSLATSAAE